MQKQQHDAYTQHQTFFAIKTEKKQAINLQQKCSHSYNTYTSL